MEIDTGRKRLNFGRQDGKKDGEMLLIFAKYLACYLVVNISLVPSWRKVFQCCFLRRAVLGTEVRRRRPYSRLLFSIAGYDNALGCQKYAELFFQPALVVKWRQTRWGKRCHSRCQRFILTVLSERSHQ